ncbi:MAG: DUF4091 domain-containing protein [Chloroflexi bacterium]|nr:DUF4091 domain-containing protein [Chloroflexota bacterium]
MRRNWRWLSLAAMIVGLLVNLQPATCDLQPLASSNIAQVWANEGGDKVWRSELRATSDPNAVLSSAWDGTGISLFGARNEVVAFNLVLEAPTTSATNVSVSLVSLTGPGGATISTVPASSDGVFNYVGRSIELFYVRYLEIKGLSVDLAYNDYDERHIPERCRRPYDENGIGTGDWEDRPCHNQFYPEIAVPLEFHMPFTIPAGANQALWGDIYIPKTMPAGNYAGTIEVTEDGELTWQIPISLRVRNFTLPDLPNAKTMIFYEWGNVNDRYLGEDNAWPEPGTPEYAQSIKLMDRHFQLAHRHKMSLINGESEIERMDDAWTSRLNGELFTPAQGYDGLGIGVGNGVYSIGTYGSWPWQDGTEADMWVNTDPWVNWFDAQAFATPTDYFLYLIDESDNYPQIEQWAQWMDNNPGPGQRLMSMATISLPDAMANTPSLDIPTSGAGFGITDEWENALAALRADPSKRFFMYNGSRPGSGSFATEDEGVALRELAWGHYKKGVERWFYWESTYYDNYQGGMGQTNVFQQAQTFGDYSYDSDTRGQAGWNYFNGDGVLFYPGTDTRFPDESYGASGPFASLRLKMWRRGIQDVDYLTLAASVNPTRTAEIVNEIVPTVLWEYGVEDPGDPTWVRTDISWSTDPDDWEAARAELADIIESALACPDLDGDGDVDIADIMLVASHWHTAVGDPGYDPTYDLDGNGKVDIVDIMLVAVHWGEGCGESTPTPTPTATPTATATATTPTATPTVTSTPTPTATPSQTPESPEVAGCPVFPADNIWNVPVDTLPLDANSDAYVATIGASSYLHPDFGSGTWEGEPIGIPYVDVPGSQPLVDVTFVEYGDESDPGPYPIPPDPPIEGGPDSDGDRHILIVDRDNCILYELYDAWPQPDGSWQAGSGAIFDLNSHALRPAGWTSADAAGLPILAGLVRYDEVASGEIRHAIRVTAPQTRREYIWPARHYASSLTGAQYPPMGQRFRLKAGFDISGFSTEVQVILQALKTYGMMLADNGASWFISGHPDERWDNDVLRELRQVHGSDFEAVDVSSLMVDPDSGQAGGGISNYEP